MAKSRHGKRSSSKKTEKTYRVLGCMKTTQKKMEKHEKRLNNGRKVKKVRVSINENDESDFVIATKSKASNNRRVIEEVNIHTHPYADLDNIIALWIIIRFQYPFSKYRLFFDQASCDGSNVGSNDIAIDIEAGGKGIKDSIDKDGIKHSSCYTVFRRTYLSTDNYQALYPLISVIDKKDVYGKLSLAPGVKELNSGEKRALEKVKALSLALRVYRAQYKECENLDELVCEAMFFFLDGLLKITLGYKNSKAEVDRKSFRCGHVFVVETSQDFSAAGKTFKDLDNKARIYVDPQTNCIGVHLNNVFYHEDGFRLRFKDLEPIVAKFNENIGKGEDKWFLHKDGFLFAWGTKKDIRPQPSKIRPEELALEINRLIENFYNTQNKKFPKSK